MTPLMAVNPVADPGFPRGKDVNPIGDANILFGQKVPKTA